MANFSITRFFEQHHKLEIPSVGVLELKAETPRFNIGDKVFEPQQYNFSFHEDVYQPYASSWEALAKYIDAEDGKQARRAILNELEKGKGVHFNGIGTLAKQPYFGYTFISETPIVTANNVVPAIVYFNQDKEVLVNVGGQSFSRDQMKQKLNAPSKKTSYWWLWLLMLILIAGGVVIGLQYSGTYKFW